MNKRLIVIVGIVVLVIAIPLVQARISGGVTVKVKTEKVAPRSIQASVLASGRLVYEQQAQLTTEEIGRVTGIFVEEGDHVWRAPCTSALRSATPNGVSVVILA